MSRVKVRLLTDSATRLVAITKLQHAVIERVVEDGCFDSDELRGALRDTDAQLAAVEDQLRTALAE